MTAAAHDLRATYLEYIACLNSSSTPNYDDIARFVNDDAVHNGRKLGVSGYTQMIADGYKTYQWLHFNVELLVVDETQQTVASRLILKGTDPNATDVPREHVIYRFRGSKISEVWSMLDGFDT